MKTAGNWQELGEKELVKVNGGFGSAGEVFGYYLRKTSKVLDLSTSGFLEVLQGRTYYF